MIDTVKMKSRYLTEDEAKHFELDAIEKFSVNKSRNQMFYHFVSCKLQGSFDNNVSIQVKRQDWTTDIREQEKEKNGEVIREERKQAMLAESEPYLIIELSLHKFILGQNVFGGSNDLLGQIRFFLNALNNAFGSDLVADDFYIMRIDYAEAYEFSSFEKVGKYIEMYKQAKYPRRDKKDMTFGSQSLYFPGTTSTVKFYHKGPEFRRHDKGRLKKIIGREVVDKIEDYANRILRVEVEVKKKTLLKEFGFYPSVFELVEKFDFVVKFWEREVNVVVNIIGNKRNFDSAFDVKYYICEQLGSRLGNSVYLTFLNLQMLGINGTRLVTSKPTYYRHIKLLKELEIDWQKTTFEIVEQKRLDPEIIDFRPTASSPVRLQQNVIDDYMRFPFTPGVHYFMGFQLERIS